MSGGYVGVAGKARKIKSLYVGVNGVARKVTKAYVGDAAGKARLWWQAAVKGLPLTVSRIGLAGAGDGENAYFGGGYSSPNVGSSAVDRYQGGNRMTAPAPLSAARGDLAGACDGENAYFGGGHDYGVNAGSYFIGLSTVDRYQGGNRMTSPTPLSAARYNLAGAGDGENAYFGGGHGGDSSGYSSITLSTVDRY